jgi:ABC-2 family transporter protein
VIWLTWRQHRQHLLVGLTLLVALGAAFAVLRGGLVTYVRGSGLSACLAEPDEGCGHLIDGLRQHYPSLLDLLPYLALVPALVGVFVGAPLLPRELERGTHRLVWTQSVSRTRWLLTKVVLLAAASITFGLALGVVARWFLSPYVDGAVVSPVQRDILGLLDVAPAAYCLFAFGLGVAAGALARRTLPAMAAALAAFVAVRLGWESLRYRLMPPRHAVTDLSSAVPAGPGRHDWVLPVSPFVSAEGTPVDDTLVARWCGPAPTKQAYQACLADHGVFSATYWEPASRFWTMQWLDVTVFGSTGVALLVVGVVLTLRQRSVR